PLALQTRYLVYRYQPGRATNREITARPLKVLAAIANPTSLGEPGNGLLEHVVKLDIAQERATIASGLKRLEASGAVEYAILDRQHGPTVSEKNLRAALRDGYHILHLVAHGAVIGQPPASEFYLVLENENGGHEFVPATIFKRLMDGSDLRLVVLVSCLSAVRPDEHPSLGLGARLVQAGVPAVIAMQDLLPISAGRSFTRTFYDELARGGQVDLAMAATRQAMWWDEKTAGHWSIPALIVSASGDRLFAGANAQQPAAGAEPGAARTGAPPAAQTANPAGETPASSASSPAAEKPKPSRFQRMNLETQLGELQTNFATVTKRIQALDIDIGLALSAADRQVFEERKAERVAERDGIVQKIAEIEDQLGTD
ncbi:MAG TPA: CHAT domain-containing protein, partial [Anaerolineae bacterium]|nr:CHAT domain-containing protein [Anaerolineae bacterium]